MPMSPMPPMPPGAECPWSWSSFGASAIITSVVSSSPATEAAFCSARRVITLSDGKVADDGPP